MNLIVVILLILLVTAIFLSYLPKNGNNFTVSSSCKGNFTATVNRIIDGDTLEVKECNKHIRLALANTPEINQNGWMEATVFTSQLCKVNSKIIVEQDTGQLYDYYGRIVALAYCQNKNLNEELIFNKFAVIMTRYCSRSEFATQAWAWNNGCKQILKK